MKENLQNFIESSYMDIINNTFDKEATRFFPIEELPDYEEFGSLYVVFGYDEFNCYNCKIAYNCDALQCDYEYDWYMPVFDDEVFDTEIIDVGEYMRFELIHTIEGIILDLKDML